MVVENSEGSQGSLKEVDRDHAEKSTHGGLGAAGFISHDDETGTFLSHPGDVVVVDIPLKGLPDFNIGVAWDNVKSHAEPEKGLLKKLMGKKTASGIDLDLGCLYKLKNGTRGGMQAFGGLHGSLEQEPYISLSQDERTGDREGPDETILVDGAHWNDIEQILIYIYIYDGARSWAEVRPQIQVRVPGEQPMVVTLGARKSQMSVCAVAGLENVRGGIKMTNYMEYFPGHAEMDRAFGFGLHWETGTKDEL